MRVGSRLGYPMPATARAVFAGRPDRVLHCDSAALLERSRNCESRFESLPPEVIHANSIRAGIVASLAAMGTGTQVIWHVHDTLPRHPLSTAVRAFASLSGNTRFIAVSHSTAKHFQGRFPFGERNARHLQRRGSEPVSRQAAWESRIQRKPRSLSRRFPGLRDRANLRPKGASRIDRCPGANSASGAQNPPGSCGQGGVSA